MFVPSSAQLQAHYEKGYCSPNQQVLEDNYQKGRDHAAEGCVCHITMRGTWAVSYPTIISDWKGPLYITSAGSGYDLVGDPNDVYGAALLQGWLDGDAIIVDHRDVLEGEILSREDFGWEPKNA